MSHATFDLQPTVLENDTVKLTPVTAGDFERLFRVASDPLIWEQHPARDRYKREVFQAFFDAAVQSQRAFLVVDTKTKELIGSSRYYDYDPVHSKIAIGFTFLSRSYWGGPHNRAMKKLLLDHAFAHVDTVVFHIGVTNIRSQKAILKLGAVQVREIDFDLNGTPLPHYEFELTKRAWEARASLP